MMSFSSLRAIDRAMTHILYFYFILILCLCWVVILCDIIIKGYSLLLLLWCRLDWELFILVGEISTLDDLLSTLCFFISLYYITLAPLNVLIIWFLMIWWDLFLRLRMELLVLELYWFVSLNVLLSDGFWFYSAGWWGWGFFECGDFNCFLYYLSIFHLYYWLGLLLLLWRKWFLCWRGWADSLALWWWRDYLLDLYMLCDRLLHYFIGFTM